MSRELARRRTRVLVDGPRAMGTTMNERSLRVFMTLGARFRDDLYGGAAIVMVVMTPIIIGGLAYGAEIGGWELTKRQVQNAADIAAYAAGTQVRSGVKDQSELAAVAQIVAE